MSSSIFFGGSVLAAVIAGAIARFAPCCISVMLPAYFASSFQNRRLLVAMTFLFAAGIATVILPIAIAFTLVPTFAQIEERTSGMIGSSAPGWQDIGWTGLVGGVFGFLVASGWGQLLYPVALVGTGGMVLTLTLVNRIALCVLTGRGTIVPARKWREWWLGCLAAGLTVAELALFAALRTAFLS